MSKPHFIEHYLIASTAHVTPNEYNALAQGETVGDSFMFLRSDDGLMLAIKTQDGMAAPDEESTEPSAGLQTLIDLAREYDCHYIRLDRDGPEIKCVEQYDWT